MLASLTRRLLGRAPAPTPSAEPIQAATPATVAAPRQQAVTAEPARAPVRRHRAPERRPPEEHARRLLAWCQADNGITGEVLASDLMAIHAEMCGELGWSLRPWNPIGAGLRRLTGGRKQYRWVDGHRLRVYVIPPAPAVADSAPRYRSITNVRRAA